MGWAGHVERVGGDVHVGFWWGNLRDRERERERETIWKTQM